MSHVHSPRPESVSADDPEEILSCAASLYAQGQGALAIPLPALNDLEGTRIPDGLPEVIDAHVHLFPERVFTALWRWFERYGWPVRYALQADEVLAFLKARGVSHVVALHYAHQPGMADALNQFMARYAEDPFVTPLATVLPGEPDAEAVLTRGLDLGLKGVKLHCHVQAFSVDAPEVAPLAAICAARGVPMVVHAGREPKSPAYPCDPHAVCSADRTERLLQDFPTLKLCVPHLGADEFAPYARLLERYDHLWLDTTMALAEYMRMPDAAWMLDVRPDRVLYGSDFPNLPYAWDRELVRIAGLRRSPDALAGLLGGNARALFAIPGTTPTVAVRDTP